MSDYMDELDVLADDLVAKIHAEPNGENHEAIIREWLEQNRAALLADGWVGVSEGCELPKAYKTVNILIEEIPGDEDSGEVVTGFIDGKGTWCDNKGSDDGK